MASSAISSATHPFSVYAKTFTSRLRSRMHQQSFSHVTMQSERHRLTAAGAVTVRSVNELLDMRRRHQISFDPALRAQAHALLHTLPLISLDEDPRLNTTLRALRAVAYFDAAHLPIAFHLLNHITRHAYCIDGFHMYSLLRTLAQLRHAQTAEVVQLLLPRVHQVVTAKDVTAYETSQMLPVLARYGSAAFAADQTLQRDLTSAFADSAEDLSWEDWLCCLRALRAVHVVVAKEVMRRVAPALVRVLSEGSQLYVALRLDMSHSLSPGSRMAGSAVSRTGTVSVADDCYRHMHGGASSEKDHLHICTDSTSPHDCHSDSSMNTNDAYRAGVDCTDAGTGSGKMAEWRRKMYETAIAELRDARAVLVETCYCLARLQFAPRRLLRAVFDAALVWSDFVAPVGCTGGMRADNSMDAAYTCEGTGRAAAIAAAKGSESTMSTSTRSDGNNNSSSSEQHEPLWSELVKQDEVREAVRAMRERLPRLDRYELCRIVALAHLIPERHVRSVLLLSSRIASLRPEEDIIIDLDSSASVAAGAITTRSTDGFLHTVSQATLQQQRARTLDALSSVVHTLARLSLNAQCPGVSATVMALVKELTHVLHNNNCNRSARDFALCNVRSPVQHTRCAVEEDDFGADTPGGCRTLACLLDDLARLDLLRVVCQDDCTTQSSQLCEEVDTLEQLCHTVVLQPCVDRLCQRAPVLRPEAGKSRDYALSSGFSSGAAGAIPVAGESSHVAAQLFRGLAGLHSQLLLVRRRDRRRTSVTLPSQTAVSGTATTTKDHSDTRSKHLVESTSSTISDTRAYHVQRCVWLHRLVSYLVQHCLCGSGMSDAAASNATHALCALDMVADGHPTDDEQNTQRRDSGCLNDLDREQDELRNACAQLRSCLGIDVACA